ncbi:ribonucleotide-diphosphate reductase subunit beta [uncultured bacterium]|nr:ribonucleotide-diphosphate reductase subunit beta [uncultured bacterium]
MKHHKTSLLGTRNNFKPYEYLFYYEAWTKQQNMFWLPSEVCMKSDEIEFKNKLTQKERDIFIDIFKLFPLMDYMVGDGYKLLMNHFNLPEISMLLSAFNNMEMIHADAYAQLSDRINLGEEIHTDYLETSIFVKKFNSLKWEINNKLDILKVIAQMSVFTEGFKLFSLFGPFLRTSHFGLLKGMGQIITLSMRDETLHHETMTQLFKDLRDEFLRDYIYRKVDIDNLIKDLNSILESEIYLELEMIDYLFRNNRNLLGFSKDELKSYIIKLAIMRSSKINLKTNIQYDEELYPKWIDEIVNLNEGVDFFSQRPTQYRKADLSDISDDDFN